MRNITKTIVIVATMLMSGCGLAPPMSPAISENRSNSGHPLFPII